MDYQTLLEKVEGYVTPVLQGLGYELVEREFIQDGGRWILRIYIDHSPQSGREGATRAPTIERAEGLITIGDCAQASRAVEGSLDVEDLIPFRYTLEVSSPGVERPLRKERDFERFKGATIDLKAKEPVRGRHHFKGVLKGLEGQDIVIEDEQGCWHVPYAFLKKARVRQDRR